MAAAAVIRLQHAPHCGDVERYIHSAPTSPEDGVWQPTVHQVLFRLPFPRENAPEQVKSRGWPPKLVGNLPGKKRVGGRGEGERDRHMHREKCKKQMFRVRKSNNM